MILPGRLTGVLFAESPLALPFLHRAEDTPTRIADAQADDPAGDGQGAGAK